jgi:hypothetical protein
MPGALKTLGRRRLALALLPVATVAVHQLRYLLAYGADAGHELIAQGDAYIESLLPGLVLLIGACAVAGLLHVWRVASGGTSAGPARRPGLWRLWGCACVALLLAYVGQEALEVLLGSAHASVLAQAFGAGGWWAVPAVITVGLGWALLARGARAVLALAARRGADRRPGLRSGRELTPARPGRIAVLWPPACPLSRRLAGRAPPVPIRL